ncbi:MAG: hypothetical protein P8L23_05580 [Flavobacteriales bacterium]|nr:hypothetical protein [Flavobacteriales bacterium]
MEFVISSIYVLLFLILISKWKIFSINDIPRKDIAAAFLIKILAAFVLIWIYSDYYKERHTADIFKYFDDSLIISSSFLNNPKDFFSMIVGFENNYEYLHQNYFINMNHWDSSYSSTILNESRLVIRLNAIVGLISFKIYFIHALFFSFISLIGFVFLVKTVKKISPKENVRHVFWVLILFPSILVFSSGVLKEPLIILGLGGFSYLLITLFKNKKQIIKKIIFLILCLLLIYKIKFYVFCCLFSGLLIFISIKKINKNPHLIFLVNLIAIGFVFMLLHLSNNTYDPISIISKKQEDFIRLAEFYNAGSIMKITEIKNDFFSFLKAIPSGFMNSLLRPFPWEITSKIHLISIFENFLMLGLIGYVLSKLKKVKKNLYQNMYGYIYSSLIFIVFLYCIVGMTTPVFGALIRYKIPGLIVLLIILVPLFKKTYKSKT